MRPAFSLVALVAVLAVLGLGVGCVNHTPAPGELMVEVSTDMSLPKDIDTVRVQILSNGQTLNDRTYAVGPSDLHIPATIGILAGSAPTATALVRVTAIRQGKAIILREATSQVPQDGIALLQVPLQFLCEGSATDKPAQGDPTDPTIDPITETTCPAKQTCIAGQCVSDVIDATKLPRYSPALVYGSSDATATTGACFDTTTCFSAPATASVDTASCTVTMPAGVSASDVNLALQTTDGQGICGGAAGNQAPCFVPLDRDPTWGWQLQGTTIQLPVGLCDVLGNGLKASVVLSAVCPSKTPSMPPCGPWSSAGTPAGPEDGGTSGAGPDGSSGGGGDSTVAANTCVSAETQFGNTAQGDSNPSFTSGVGVRTKTQLLIFSGYAGGGEGGAADAGDGGTDNLVYVQAFDPTTANSLGPAKPLFAAPDGAGFIVDSASVAPTGEIALALSYGGPYSYVNGSQYTQTSLYAAFLGASAEAGPAGLTLQSTKELQTGGGPVGSAHFGISGQPHVIWSVAVGAFVFSWEYYTTNPFGVFVGTENFRPNGQAAGGTNPVPTDDMSNATIYFPNAYGLNWEDQGSFAAGPSFSGVAYVTGGNTGAQYLTILDQSGNQVGGSVPIVPPNVTAPSQTRYLWVTVAATAEGFVYIYDVPSNAQFNPNTVEEVFVPASGDAGVVLPDAGDAGLGFAGFKFTGVTANNGHAISDDTGGAGGVGVALLYPTGLSFAYVNADGITHVGPTSVIPHTYADDDQINITNFGGSFGLSLYSAASQSTQMAASGCQ